VANPLFGRARYLCDHGPGVPPAELAGAEVDTGGHAAIGPVAHHVALPAEHCDGHLNCRRLAEGRPLITREQRHQVDEAIAKGLSVLRSGGVCLIDFHIDPDENVYPMIAPGKGLHEMVGVKQ
jgi:hypothetical protein